MISGVHEETTVVLDHLVEKLRLKSAIFQFLPQNLQINPGVVVNDAAFESNQLHHLVAEGFTDEGRLFKAFAPCEPFKKVLHFFETAHG